MGPRQRGSGYQNMMQPTHQQMQVQPQMQENYQSAYNDDYYDEQATGYLAPNDVYNEDVATGFLQTDDDNLLGDFDNGYNQQQEYYNNQPQQNNYNQPQPDNYNYQNQQQNYNQPQIDNYNYPNQQQNYNSGNNSNNDNYYNNSQQTFYEEQPAQDTDTNPLVIEPSNFAIDYYDEGYSKKTGYTMYIYRMYIGDTRYEYVLGYAPKAGMESFAKLSVTNNTRPNSKEPIDIYDDDNYPMIIMLWNMLDMTGTNSIITKWIQI